MSKISMQQQSITDNMFCFQRPYLLISTPSIHTNHTSRENPRNRERGDGEGERERGREGADLKVKNILICPLPFGRSWEGSKTGLSSSNQFLYLSGEAYTQLSVAHTAI